MKKGIIIIVLILVLISISGCGVSKNNALEIAEDAVEKEFEGFSDDMVDYGIKATEATKNLGNWDVVVNVSITEEIEDTGILTQVDGYYLVIVDSKGAIKNLELKQLGAFKP